MKKYLNYEGLQHLITWIKNTFLQKNALKINEIKRNNTVIEPVDKSVNISVPIKVSELTNDAGYQTKADVKALLNSQEKIKKAIVESLPSSGEENIIYLVKNSSSGNNVYDEYMWIDSKWEKIGDTATTVVIESITTAEIDALTA